MRHLKTAYGEILDLQERVVGDFFDDRADGDIRNSILEVHTYPPTPDQLDILQRFSSLAPTSSVRPRKRPLELPSQSYPSQSQFSREIPSIEEWDADAVTSFEGTKRQRTQEQSGRPFHSSQTSGTQGSIHQVLDSQKSSRKKRTSSSLFSPIVILIYHTDSNPYGTPTSLALVGQQHSVPSSEIDLSIIPDSPLARDSTSGRGAFAGAIPLGREGTKSESPELRASVHKVPTVGSVDALVEQPITSAIPPESPTIPSSLESAPQPEANPQYVEKEDMARAEESAQTKKARAKAKAKAKAKVKARAEAKAEAEARAVKERELADVKRIETEARISEEKKTREWLAREQRIKEVSLAEEANKTMLVADGAKQIEAERERKEKARHEELPAKKQADQAEAEEKAKEAQAKAHERKAREENRARDKAQKLADSECKDAKEPVLPPRTARETATAVKEQAQQRIAERETQKLRSSSDVQSQRSMTPRMPGSSITKSSSLMTSLRSSPTNNRSPGNTDAPLRSALRQTPSSLHRSVSSVSFDVAQPANLNTRNAPMSNPKSLKEISLEAAAKTPSATDVTTSPPGNMSSQPSKTPVRTPVAKKAPGRKITKPPAKNGKVQTKLNVTRVPKKLKGRAVAPPVKSTQPAPRQEIVISSGEDSSTSEEPSWQTGNAEAGPSSREPTLPVVSQKTKPAEVQASVTRIPPGVRTKKTQMDSTVTPAALPRRNSTLNMASMPKSISQSPAQITSETISISSDSASEKELQAPMSKVLSGTKGVTRGVLGSMKKLSKDVNHLVKQPEDYSKGKAPPQSVIRISPSRSDRIIPAKGNGEHINEAADRQLQLESRPSIPDSRVNVASSIPNGAPVDTIINQGLDHAGRLPNGIRPVYYDYPKLSELQKLPRAVTPETQSKINSITSQPVGDSPVSRSESEYSSSDGDQRSSSPDGDEDVDRRPPQLGSPKPYPGVKRLAQSR